MSEAKRRREEFRQAALIDIERWLEPPSDAERALLIEVEALPFSTIERAPKRIMEYCLMKPQDCHRNAWGYCGNDPSMQSSVVSGWWRKRNGSKPPIYVHHSVVRNPSGTFCITPHFDEEFLEFAPDPAIEWLEIYGMRHSRRNSKPIPYGVREDPDIVITHATMVRQRLLSGKNSWDALKV